MSRPRSNSKVSRTLSPHRHCERSEAIQSLSEAGFWIASSQGLLAMTEQGAMASFSNSHLR
ncbi:hypothetical protein, partial [Bradyrhizobium genosp. SA-3]|uniref:hypothetical protein n=1 Tax=Bradyrhizobium genosp. SA-3 TaxID=508868 RepID=UPI001ABFE7A9